MDGKAIDRLTDQKHEKYPELVASDRVHYVVLRRTVGNGRLLGSRGPRQAQSRAAASSLAPVGRAGVHEAVVGCLGHGRAISSRGLRAWPRPSGVGATRSAAAPVGARVGRRRAGAVADLLSTCPGPRSGPECISL